MDRRSAMAWIEELAADVTELAAPADGPALARRTEINPTCGDQVAFTLGLDPAGGVQLRGTVRGCALSTAAAVVGVRTLEGMPVAAATPLIAAAWSHRLTGAGPPVDGDLGQLASLDLVPLRRRCVALPWQLIGRLLDDVQSADQGRG